MVKESEGKNIGTLGQHLAAIRIDRGFSLRQVEDLTKKIVSNGYLSQIETGKIRHPSPNILHALSEIYKASYEQLMTMAGYINAQRNESIHSRRVSTLSSLNVSQAEEMELVKYLNFRRKMNKQ